MIAMYDVIIYTHEHIQRKQNKIKLLTIDDHKKTLNIT